MKSIFDTKLGNYYGRLEICEKDNEYFLMLEDYDGFRGVKISKTLANLIIEEISTKEAKDCIYIDEDEKG